MKVITMGAHILDVLVRPVTDIPPGQETALVEQMRMTAAGTAAGTALTFTKLGAAVRTAGAIGTDPAGDLLLSLLSRAGIDTSLVVRKPDVPTSMTVLPIRPNVERPSLHLLGPTSPTPSTTSIGMPSPARTTFISAVWRCSAPISQREFSSTPRRIESRHPSI